MGGLITLGAILIIIAYFFGRIGHSFDGDKERSDYSKLDGAVNKAVEAEDNKTRNLLLNTLRKIGCQPNIDEDNKIHFQYQGEVFGIDAENGRAIIIIWDTWWAHFPLNDPDINNLKAAINYINIDNSVVTLYSINEENERLGIHSKHTLLFIPEIQNIDEYLRAILDNFFVVHQSLKDKFDALNREMEKTDKERITVKGFKKE